MKTVADELAEALASGVTTSCLCWTLTRTDGFELAVTEHYRALVIGVRTFQPGGALEGARFTSSASLAPGQAELAGALSHDAISEADLDGGLWDGARVEVQRVDWRMPEHAVPVWSGRLSRIRRGITGFEAELVSLKADLERPIGRVYSRRCDAVFGDARCGADAEAFPGLSCDHRFETCRDVFANAENFRGFPHLPGTEALVAGPPATGNTGGRR